VATSACSGVAQHDVHFWCANRGLNPALLPTSRVNDGICDCCDGADELTNPRAACQDTCSEGLAAVADRRRALAAGALKRAALLVDVASEVESQRTRLALMDAEVGGGRKRVLELPRS
jgi:protein kinase C substrate 80K-H